MEEIYKKIVSDLLKENQILKIHIEKIEFEYSYLLEYMDCIEDYIKDDEEYEEIIKSFNDRIEKIE